MRTWTHYNPVHVVARRQALQALSSLLPEQRIVLVTSPGFRRRGVVARIEPSLGERLVGVLDEVRPNPDLHDLDRQAETVRAWQPEALLALGGGSSMDTAKALARLLAQTDGPSLLEHFHRDVAFPECRSLPVIAIPTTAGTGSEVTPFATIWDAGEGKKYSLAGDDLYPRMAILDDALTSGLPMEVAVASGLDAVSHAFESTWNRHATPVSLALAAQSLTLSLPALAMLAAGENSPGQRADMLMASTLAGMAISQTRTALAHSMSYPLTASFGLPHGLACSFTLPALLRFNVQADDGRLHRLARGMGMADAEALANALDTLLHKLDMGRHLDTHLPDRDAVLALVPRMFTPGRADNNLRAVDAAAIRQLVAESLDALHAA